MSRSFAPAAERLRVGDRAREADPAGVRIGARESEESAAHLHRGRAGAAAGHRQLLPERRAGGVQGGERTRRCMAEFQEVQPGRDRCAEGVRAVPARTICCRARNGDFRIGAENLSQEAAVRRDGGYAARPAAGDRLREPAPQPGGVQEGGRADRSQAHAGSRSWTRRRRTIRPATSCCRAFRDVLGGLRDFIENANIVTIPSPVAADCGGDAAVHARADHGVHGHAGAVRKGRQGGVLQRDAAGEELDARSRRRSTWKASIAAPSSARRSTKSIRATTRSSCGSRARRRKVRKLLGCGSNAEGWAHYTRADDARRGLRQWRSETAARPVAGRAAAQRALHRRHPDAHRQDDRASRPSSSS